MDSSSFISIEDNPNQDNEGNKNLKKKKGGSQKKSWVWDWFVPDDEAGSVCHVEMVNNQICGKHYKNGSSTGILIGHLQNKHQITKLTKKQDYVVRNILNKL